MAAPRAIAQIAKQAPGALMLAGGDYLLHFSMPSFYFHVTTAYDILRHNGLEIGKDDFMGEA